MTRGQARCGRVLVLLLLAVSLLGVAPTVGPLTHVQLEFATPVLPRLAEVEVLDASGEDHASGRPATFGTKMVTPVRSVDRSGRYELRYRVVAVDGHPVVGSYHFTVAASAGAVDKGGADSALAADPRAPGIAPPWLVPLLAGLAVLTVAGARVVQYRRKAER